MEYQERGSYGYLLTGIILGIVLGLVTAWYWFPVQRIDTHPGTLRSDFKDAYREMIAAAFTSNGDVGRAHSRLVLLQDGDAVAVLSSQAQLSLASGGSADTARELGVLAAALSGSSQVATNPTATLTPNAGTQTAVVIDLTNGVGSATGTGTLQATATLVPSITPSPTLTPTATTGAPFSVEIFSEICNPNQLGPMILVYVFDASRRPVPGVEVAVRWEGGLDTFYTGLKPEIGLGFADFQMEHGVSYSVELSLGDQPVSGFITRECQTEDGKSAFSSWEIIFVQS